MTELSQKRKADRKKMADAVVKIAHANGFDATVREDGRCLNVRVSTTRGLGVMINIDGGSGHEGFLGHWYIFSGYGVKDGVKLSDAFEIVGERNRSHFAKATTFATGFPTFLNFIDLGLKQAKSGEAFQ